MATVSSPAAGYFFGDCELDVLRGCLSCGGSELPLRYQSFQLLLYFVQHPGTLISKDELSAAVWADTSVTDNALVQCVTEIRRALGDDPRKPRFIKTYPKVGYRFIASVEAAPTKSVGISLVSKELTAVALPQPPPQQAAILLEIAAVDEPVGADFDSDQSLLRPASTHITLGRNLWHIGAFCTLSVLFLLMSGDSPNSLGLGRSIVHPAADAPILAVFPFTDATGTSNVDWEREDLSKLILANLTRTGRWHVFSPERMRTSVDDSTSPASPVQALKIAKLLHAEDFVLGTVSKSGHQIALHIETRSGVDGRLIATDNTMISDPHEIAAEAGSLAVKIGAHLDTPSEQSNSPMEAITHNLDAYRYYSLGVEKAEQFQNSQAIQLFKKAIEADPKFAMAYARIGYAYAVQDYQHQQARPYFDKAIRYSASLPPVKLLYIEAWSAIANSDYNSAIGVLRQITTQYPNETEAYCQLSRILRGQERVEEAAELLRDAIQKNPEAKDLYNAYGLILLSLNRPTESIGAYKQYVALAPQNPNSHDSLGMSYELAGEYEAALAEFNQALRLDPEFEPSIVHMGDTYYQQGRYHEALDEYRRYIQVTASTDAKAIGYSDLSTVYRTMGDLDNAQVAASEELRFNRNAVWDSLVIALAKGQKARAIALKTALFANLPNPERGSPRDLRSEFYYRGYIELKTGESQLALTHFKSALQHLPPSSGIDLREDCLANAYFDLGMTSESIAEYQRILKLNPNYPLAYFHLGKSYLRAHRNREAQEAFQHFLESSPTADQDSPSLLEAKNTKFRAA